MEYNEIKRGQSGVYFATGQEKVGLGKEVIKVGKRSGRG
jgi:hypothetical protein